MDTAPGDTIGGRYRIEKRAWDAAPGTVWLAFDTILERSVLVQTFPGADPEAISRAVARSAQITHPGLCQIYDVSASPPAIVFENAPGGRLSDRKDGAFPAANAAAFCARLASAIGALHEHDLAHGSIGPRTVLFDEEGRPKICAAVPVPEDGEDRAFLPPDPDASSEERDRYALGAIAYRLFTGRDPGPDAPPARAAKRGIPPQVDALLSRALARDAADRPSLAEFRRVLEPIATHEPPERGPGFFRQESSWLVPVLVVIGIGIVAIALGVRTLTTKSNGPSPARSSPTPATYTVVSVEDFDPQGDGEEHHSQVGRVIDGKDTAWSTYGYANPLPDGKKKGVGLLFDLGEPKSVGRIDVRTPDEGWTAEWRTSDEKGPAPGDYDLAQSFPATGDPVVFGSPIRARYWLLWITHLVNSESGNPHPFEAQVSEVTFFAR